MKKAMSFWMTTEITLQPEYTQVATTLTASEQQTVIFDFSSHAKSQASPRIDLALHNGSSVTYPWRYDGKRHGPMNGQRSTLPTTVFQGSFKCTRHSYRSALLMIHETTASVSSTRLTVTLDSSSYANPQASPRLCFALHNSSNIT